ncbi:MAG TPA: hypothetical protein VM098_08005, partial [Phycisphaerae bacterium]|nr:hypothetical protein [Phycisphaerae bacterium]
MITVRCSCGRDVTVEDHLAGKSTKCPSCGSQVSIPASGEPKRPAPAAAAEKPAGPVPGWVMPQPRPRTPVPSVGYYPPPPAPPKPAEAQGAGKAGLIFLCILVLLTVVVPWDWDVRGGRATWSWDVLRSKPQSYVMFVISLWAAGFFGFVLGCAFSGLSLSILLAVLSSAGMALMFAAFGTKTLVQLAGPLSGLSSRALVLSLTAALAMLLFVSAAVRGRAGGGAILGFLQAVASAGCLAMLAVLLIPSIRRIVSDLRGIRTFDAFVRGDGLTYAWMLLCLLLVFLGSLVGLLHGLAFKSTRGGPAKAAAALVRISVVLLMLHLMLKPAVTNKWKDIASAVTKVIVIYSLPLLFCSGASRLISDLMSA